MIKMARVGMGFGELTVESGPNGLEVRWSDSKLNSARIEFIDNYLGGRQPSRGVMVTHEKDHDKLGSRELVLFPREQIGDDLILRVLHDVEECRGELQARWHDGEQRWNARQGPAGSHRSGPFQAVFRSAVGRVGSEVPCRCDGWPDLALAGIESNGGREFRGKRVREERKKIKKVLEGLSRF